MLFRFSTVTKPSYFIGNLADLLCKFNNRVTLHIYGELPAIHQFSFKEVHFESNGKSHIRSYSNTKNGVGNFFIAQYLTRILEVNLDSLFLDQLIEAILKSTKVTLFSNSW